MISVRAAVYLLIELWNRRAVLTEVPSQSLADWLLLPPGTPTKLSLKLGNGTVITFFAHVGLVSPMLFGVLVFLQFGRQQRPEGLGRYVGL